VQQAAVSARLPVQALRQVQQAAGRVPVPPQGSVPA